MARILRCILVLLSVSGATATAAEKASNRLLQVRHFMYQIQQLETPGAVQALAETPYDMLVVEPTDTAKGMEAWDGAAMVRTLKADRPGRLVLAYIDIGEAESYRTYWGADWRAPAAGRPGTPDFIVKPDPDGWSGNYPVAFWDPRWSAIVVDDPTSLLRRALADGFDGVYMDWVEAYDDADVKAAAAAAGMDPARAMIDLITHIRATARAVDPQFLVVAQNAPYLLDGHPEYARVIDGAGFEDTWFGGKADAVWTDPAGGDVPNAYTGQWSTAARIAQFQKYRVLGLPVFTIDYCLQAEHAAIVYAASSGAGFVPLVTRISLSQITGTPPPWLNPRLRRHLH